MPLPELKLDDLTYAQLVDEARSLIPSLDPDWTNHNPSDPGIMLIELLAWLSEMLIYRTDQVSEASYWKFLKLLNGGEHPEWLDHPLSRLKIDDAKHETVSYLRRPYRAVTAQDYEDLVTMEWHRSMEANQLGSNAPIYIARAHAVEQQDLETPGQQREQAAHVSLLVMPVIRYPLLESLERKETEYPINLNDYPAPGPDTISVRARWSPADTRLAFRLVRADDRPYPNDNRAMFRRPPVRWDVPVKELAAGSDWKVLVKQEGETPITGEIEIALLPPRPTDELRMALWRWLDNRRLLTVRHHVVSPTYVPLTITAFLHIARDTTMEAVRQRAIDALYQYFDPLPGGRQKPGWPLGRDIYLSEVSEALVSVPGIEYVRKLILRANGKSIISEEGMPDEKALINVDSHMLVHLQAVDVHDDTEYPDRPAADRGMVGVDQ